MRLPTPKWPPQMHVFAPATLRYGALKCTYFMFMEHYCSKSVDESCAVDLKKIKVWEWDIPADDMDCRWPDLMGKEDWNREKEEICEGFDHPDAKPLDEETLPKAAEQLRLSMRNEQVLHTIIPCLLLQGAPVSLVVLCDAQARPRLISCTTSFSFATFAFHAHRVAPLIIVCNVAFHAHPVELIQIRLMSHKKYAKAKPAPSRLDLLESTIREQELEEQQQQQQR